MTDAERLTAIQAFIAALHRVAPGGRPIPYDPSSFARVVKDLAETGNVLAQQFGVFNTAAGPSSPDFLQGMTAAQSAGLISRMNPTYEFFSIQLPLSVRRRIEPSTDQERQFAQGLAKAYYDAVRPGLLSSR
jgi:hypothetical protein